MNGARIKGFTVVTFDDVMDVAKQSGIALYTITLKSPHQRSANSGSRYFSQSEFAMKALAQETARATEDIAHRVDAIQVDTAGAVGAIGEIAAIIGSINDYQGTIASAVEEQTATTNEMSRNVADAADGVGQIAGNMTSVAETARSATEAAGESQAAAEELAGVSSQLRALVAGFRF